RAASTADPGFVFVVLQSDAHALGIGQGCAATASCPRLRNDYCHTNSVRIASSLRADMIFGKDRSPSRRVLRGLSARQENLALATGATYELYSEANYSLNAKGLHNQAAQPPPP